MIGRTMTTKLLAALMVGVMMIGPAAAQNHPRANEKQILLTMVTIVAAQHRCSNTEVNHSGAGWVLVAEFTRRDQDYINTWSDSAAKLVGEISLLPTFCDDVRGAYGPEGIPAPRLPWATPAFRGMLNAASGP